MKKIIPTTLLALMALASINMEAQSIVRSTLCGTGATWTNSSGSLTSTFGQCPGCGTLSSNAGILTQGFQQPSPDTCFSAAFQYTENIDNCGTTYRFNYTGDADLGLVEFVWDFGQDGFPQTSTLVNPQDVSFGTTGIKTVSLKVIGGDCEKMILLNIDVQSIGFAANAITNPITCNGDANGNIQIEVNIGTAPFDYKWSTGEQSAKIENLAAGDYAYIVTDANGCETTNIITLTDPSVISLDALTQSETCEGDLDGSIEVTVSGGTSPYSLQWDNGDVSTLLANLSANQYALTVIDANDCTDEFVFLVGRSCELAINDVVSPNGDGSNDTWIIQGISEFPDNEVTIFNRWGQRIWYAKPYANDWTGTNNDGETLPIGAYFYVMELNDTDNQVLSGSVTLVR